ncbi:CCR4-NOT transcription complex subunit 1-like [Camellia sinensis]|uniref:CCR4-NOT transcription complex subunit 1-like n=1 Tax=Camellia sinensis TaxID=4442 RepID=UPI001036DCF8|nr:CCR4-NOT transcription complex subunit 1-like [Camellia sinensis]
MGVLRSFQMYAIHGGSFTSWNHWGSTSWSQSCNFGNLYTMTNNDSVEFLIAMDIFWILIVDFVSEGRYLFLNAIANQIRNPNNHTHFFSYVLLYLFVNADKEIIQEQITRVLLEGVIVNRPHLWRLLITFIELIENPKYNFLCRSFTRCAP